MVRLPFLRDIVKRGRYATDASVEELRADLDRLRKLVQSQSRMLMILSSQLRIAVSLLSPRGLDAYYAHSGDVVEDLPRFLEGRQP